MENRLDKYFEHYLDNYVFLELMPHYIKRERLDFMRNVPMPIAKEYLKKLAGDEGIRFQYFVEGMIAVIGIAPSFKYAPQYINFLKYVNGDISSSIVSIGIEMAKKEQLERAAIQLRAALRIDENNPDAIYNYMLVCRNLYSVSDDEDYVFDFKAEVFDLLTQLQKIRPEFAMTYYFLGFAHVNAGRYAAADAAWRKFISLSGPCDEYDEIKERLDELKIPVKIEEGYTNIIDGHWERGLAILEKYKDEPALREWWPLYYYLGVGYSRTEHYEKAIPMLLEAFEQNPSGAEILAELVIANNAVGDEVSAEKYRKKLELVRKRKRKESEE